MTLTYTEIAKLLFDIENSFIKLAFFFLILVILSVFLFFTNGIIPKLILASLYGLFLSKFLSFHMIFCTNNFLLHQVVTEKLSLNFEVIFVFNRLTYLESAVEIFVFSLLLLAACNGILLLKDILNV